MHFIVLFERFETSKPLPSWIGCWIKDLSIIRIGLNQLNIIWQKTCFWVRLGLFLKLGIYPFHQNYSIKWTSEWSRDAIVAKWALLRSIVPSCHNHLGNSAFCWTSRDVIWTNRIHVFCPINNIFCVRLNWSASPWRQPCKVVKKQIIWHLWGCQVTRVQYQAIRHQNYCFRSCSCDKCYLCSCWTFFYHTSGSLPFFLLSSSSVHAQRPWNWPFDIRTECQSRMHPACCSWRRH